LFHAGEKTLEISLLVATLEIPLPLGGTVIAGALTLTLLVLPVVIISGQEALRAVPSSIRHAAYALGATRWQTIRHQVLPAALPGMATGIILSLSRAMGETAPLLMIGALTYLPFTPGRIEGLGDLLQHPEALLKAPFDSFTAIPILIYNWVSRPQAGYPHVAAAGIVVLLAVLLAVNALAIYIRHRFQAKLRW
jgi:phosphate transport system permease protein